ncbi:hypothetical protein [Salinisphaera sp. G21_0]|uniref:hypothetical protein n=1 Tax=Salinisphaera sp. G21_0 TaxID=2821094 RepID=UPI001ADB14E4|nr:hypothetical protein [Salinisphaera sp. G21_0]MBO9482820.1 hypothetical protein [Salinisphaera sp. G21_0]
MFKNLIISFVLITVVIIQEPLVADDVGTHAGNTAQENPYLNFLNIWGGNSLKILFNLSTMKIEATAESGNFSNVNDNFSFKVIDQHTGNAFLQANADSLYVNRFVRKINGSGFSYGDVVALNIDPGSGLKNPTLYGNSSSGPVDCIGKYQYFAITPDGLTPYTPGFRVQPIQILGAGTVNDAVISGTAPANSKISAVVNGRMFSGSVDSSGNFSFPITDHDGFTAATPIVINWGAFSETISPTLLPKNNLPQETVTGYNYMLNAGLDYLTAPFPHEIVYSTKLLTPDAVKAWDLVYRLLLAYDNTGNRYPRDAQGNVELYVDYASRGITITGEEAEMIQKYLVRNCPRLFHLKDWPASPKYSGSTVVGQTFYIGNSAQDGNDYAQQLLQTEPSVSYLLSLIQPDMSIYQIIQVIQVNYERMVTYRADADGSDIRGAFLTRTAICGGYAKGYEYLMQRLGIETIWVEGHAGGGLHAWNFVNVFSHWYLSDTTWGGKNWFLNGADSIFTEGHVVEQVYRQMPVLANDSVPWGIGEPGQTVANLTGVVNYTDNDNGSVTITYEDVANINTSVQINLSSNGYDPVSMINSGGLWSITVPWSSGEHDPAAADVSATTLDFYFTVNNQFFTSGNVKRNNLQSDVLPDGMNNVVLTMPDS